MPHLREYWSRYGRFLRVALIIFIAVLNFVPIYWMLLTSLKTPDNILSISLASILPTDMTLANFEIVLTHPRFLGFVKNSLIVASSVTIITLIVASFAGYSLARLRFPGSRLLGRVTLLTYIVPPVLLVVPMFVIITRLGLQRSLGGVIIAHTSFALPFCLWMLRGFFLSLPPDLEEAAMIDGASRPRAFMSVVLPLAAPGLAAAAMFAFLLSWNEYLYALVFIADDSLRTLPVGITNTWQSYSFTSAQDWSNLLAASSITSLPMFVLFAGLQRWIVSGLSAGAVKG